MLAAAVGWETGRLTATILAGAAAALAGLSLTFWHQRRWMRRRRLLADPISASWRRLFEERIEPYGRLPSKELLDRFETDVRVFLAEKRITGIGLEVDEELKLLVAASAVTLSVGWPDFDWDELAGVLLYPDNFDRDYQRGDELAGKADRWGTVILSAPSLRRSFENPWDDYHAGFHEFAHLLDLSRSEFDGVPEALVERDIEHWQRLLKEETKRIHRRQSILDPYAASHASEFFPVAVETFFESPLRLRRYHRDLYDFLARYFHQDPAEWDYQRGVRYGPEDEKGWAE